MMSLAATGSQHLQLPRAAHNAGAKCFPKAAHDAHDCDTGAAAVKAKATPKPALTDLTRGNACDVLCQLVHVCD